MSRAIDLNADLGEGGMHDAAMIPLVSSVNIACGGHAGDSETMRRTIFSALAAGAAVGAHPGYEDRANLGRIPLSIDGTELLEMIIRQLSLFRQVAEKIGATVHHVKPHGALYNQADKDGEIASTFVQAVATIFPGTKIYCPPSGKLAAACNAAALEVVPEGFADRRYADDGTLVPRSEPNAVLEHPDDGVVQALRIVSTGSVITRSGRMVSLPARTLCVHGDGPAALVLLQAVRAALENAGVIIAAP
jgi:5-oxoprolinase (ATP-hydrolysing) subunit A